MLTSTLEALFTETDWAIQHNEHEVTGSTEHIHANLVRLTGLQWSEGGSSSLEGDMARFKETV